MRIAIIQLSDMHCIPSSYEYTEKIDKAVVALKTIGKFDSAIVVFSGDLTDNAAACEFNAGKHLLGRFIGRLSETYECGFIHMLIVPGNHDMVLPKDSRDVKEIEQWKDLDNHLNEEFDRLNDFFKYSNRKDCFTQSKLYDIKNIELGNLKIQFCLLNSAPFSTREREDKQLHYFPSYVGEKLIRNPETDLKITIMHHHFEWCEWETKEMIKQGIASDDITFFGHDHKAESLISKYADGNTYNIIMGGRFDLNIGKDASFNAIVYDSETIEIDRYEFNWHTDVNLFVSTALGSVSKKSSNLTLSEKYVSKLLNDKQGISDNFTKYYVLPKLTVEGGAFSSDDEQKDITFADIFSSLKTDRAVHITGGTGAGKSTLLKFLYLKCVDFDYKPLFVEKRDYSDSRIEKMFHDLFDEQYEKQSEHSYDTYKQYDSSKKIVFIDDIDLIKNDKAKQNLFDYILDSKMLVIYTTKDREHSLEEIVKDRLQGKTISTIDISPIYKETRDAIIEKVGEIYKRSPDDIEIVKMSLDYMVQSQTSFFSFTPGNTLQYIKFFLQADAKSRRSVQTISLVYETNIRHSLIEACKNDMLVNMYLSALEYLADQMYFSFKAEKVEMSHFIKIVEEYNDKKRGTINAKEFLTICKEACILTEGQKSFDISFYEKNTYAYFVAKSMNRELEKDNTNQTKLFYVMNHICFGINDTIILFLSFIRSNSTIVLNIAKEAEELMQEYPEWDFVEENLPFISQTKDMPSNAPSREEREETYRQVEKIEKERQDLIRFRGIFDYDENDVNKTRFRILRALKYVQLIGRALVDQYGTLDADEIDALLDTIFVVPQKIVYATLKPYQEHIDELVQDIMAFAKKELPDENIKEEYILKLLGNAGTALALNILNDVSFNVSNESTIKILREEPAENFNHKVMKLMMEENTGNTSEFVSRAIMLRKEMEKSPYAQLLIAQIARKHITYTSSIDHRFINQLISGNVLSKDSKPSLLIDQAKRDQH